MKRPRFPANAKRLNARAWVLGVEFSESIVRIVLETSQQAASRNRRGVPDFQATSEKSFGDLHNGTCKHTREAPK